MYSLLKMGIFYCYVSLPEGIQPQNISPYLKQENKQTPTQQFVKSIRQSSGVWGDKPPEQSQKNNGDCLGLSRGMNNYPVVYGNFFHIFDHCKNPYLPTNHEISPM